MSLLRFSKCLPHVLIAVLVACGCSEALQEESAPPPERVGSPNARPEMVATFKQDLAATRHPSDGQGRAWIESGGDATVSTPGTWEIVYEAGALGVSESGAVYLQVSPFWGWDTPQVAQENGPGFTRVRTEAKDVELLVEAFPGQPLRIEITGRDLREGEQISILYGAGSMGSRADLYAESASRFWIAVDGDGDGIRKVLADSPSVRVNPGPASRLVLTLTSRAGADEPVSLTVAVLDKYANAGVEFEGILTFLSGANELGFPKAVEFTREHAGRTTIQAPGGRVGIHRIRAEVRFDGTIVTAESNPLQITKASQPLYWADLHGHSSYSDGTGTPAEYLNYARDIAALDVIALTDHDHFGLLFLDAHEDRWHEIITVTNEYHQPGEFVALLGFEWTSWIYGHRHVLYFEEQGVIHSSLSDEADTPQELWKLLRGTPALTITHHSAGNPIANDWSIPPDPVLEPVAEVMSVHGSSEAEDSPLRLRGFMHEHSVRSALDRGYKLGFVGSGDSHDGHPGLPHLSPSYGFRPPGAGREGRVGRGGLAAVQATELTREAILQAIRERRVYATSGPRILLDVHLANHAQGSTVAAAVLPTKPVLTFSIIGTANIERIDVIQSGAVVSSTDGANRRELSATIELSTLVAGEYVYLRVVQIDGGLAWSSPIFVE